MTIATKAILTLRIPPPSNPRSSLNPPVALKEVVTAMLSSGSTTPPDYRYICTAHCMWHLCPFFTNKVGLRSLLVMLLFVGVFPHLHLIHIFIHLGGSLTHSINQSINLYSSIHPYMPLLFLLDKPPYTYIHSDFAMGHLVVTRLSLLCHISGPDMALKWARHIKPTVEEKAPPTVQLLSFWLLVGMLENKLLEVWTDELRRSNDPQMEELINMRRQCIDTAKRGGAEGLPIRAVGWVHTCICGASSRDCYSKY